MQSKYLLSIGVNSDGAEDALNVGGFGGSISSKNSKHVRSDVTHLAENDTIKWGKN